MVQNVICFGLVDRGATFSCIANKFFQFLGGNSLGTTFKASNNDSVVQLAHEVTTVPGEGTGDLDISYCIINIIKIIFLKYFHFILKKMCMFWLGWEFCLNLELKLLV